ncbi:MAG: LemA family protein [Chthonomonas sp.]|nr:LemA family protein [Chthonomonas sp.]
MDARLVGLILLAVIALYAVLTFNRFVQMRHRVTNAWQQVEIQLSTRDRLVDQLLELDALHAEHQREMVGEILQARQRLAECNGVGPCAEANLAMREALTRFLTIVEDYPNAPEIADSLVRQIGRAEDKVAFTQQFYNDRVTALNTKLDMFPSRWVGKLAKVSRAELFDAEPSRAMPTLRA